MNLKIEDIILAYRKLKSYAYYDNSSIILKKQVIKFEDEKIENELKKVLTKINNGNFKKDIDKIEVHYLPKKANDNEEDNEKINNILDDKVVFESVICVSDIPITLQLLGILWIIKTHKYFEDTLSDSVYANKIRDTKNNTISLFEPYYNKYSEWRDNGINVIQDRLNKKKSIVYITMDIKDYYYSVDMKNKEIGFEKLKEELVDYYGEDDEIHELTDLVEAVCEKYSSLLIENDRTIIPIGYLPSNVLANWYLKALDEIIKENVNPIYYGRYVDDIILVCNIYDTNKTKEEIINKYLINTKVLTNIGKTEYKVYSEEYKDLKLQQKKLNIKVLDYRYSSAEIELFKNELDKNKSEFKILPENIEQCIGDIYKVNYNGEKNKIRNLKGIEIDKLELSKSISKIIFKGKQDIYNKSSSEFLNKEIKYIFNYVNGIINFRLWEKIIFYLNQNGNIDILKNLIENLQKSIEKLELNINNEMNYTLKDNPKEIKEKIKSYLKINLNIAISMSGAINYEYIKNLNLSEEDIQDIKQYTEKIIKSNMMKHSYIPLPLINYCKTEDNLNVNFNSYDIDNIVGKKFDCNYYKVKFSPRFIHLHELSLFYYLSDLKEKTNLKNEEDYLEKSKEDFKVINYHKESLLKVDLFLKEPRTIGIGEFFGNKKIYEVMQIKVDSDEDRKEKFKIALANLKVDNKKLEEVIKGNKYNYYKNLKLLKRILNEAAENEVDFVVLPEASVPIEWINLIADFSRRHNMVIICGVQHFRIKGTNKIVNNLMTVLPIKKGKYMSSIIKFRLKNHYAPFEKELINTYCLDIPKEEKIKYDLFIWNDVNFTCYNCFELACIEDRALMKGNIDVMFASVLNKDIAYFSNIIESVTRDLHCYFVQVNTSQYGDNRITQPASRDYRDIVKIKGGENSFLVIGEVNIKKLREFQILDSRSQINEKNKSFKPTPPNFQINKSREKLGLEEIYEEKEEY